MDERASDTAVGATDDLPLEERIEGLELLYRIGIALSAERNHNRLIERILREAKTLCHADAGTIYLMTADNSHLEFAIMLNDTMGTALGGTTGRPVEQPPIPIYDPDTGEPNRKNVATYAAAEKASVNVEDAYTAAEFDFSGTKRYDEANGYRSKSFLTIPLLNNADDVIGVLQLINAMDTETREVVPFPREHQRIVEALAAQAAIALDNQLLLEAQRHLLESFIQLIAGAIDAKSPYTGGHCERVPILTEMLTQAACDDHDAFASFDLTHEEWYELRIAAWLHDCGKVTTPVHVMDKATKLHTLSDRIEVVQARFDVLKSETIIRHLEAGGSRDDEELKQRLSQLDEDLRFLEKSNTGGEFLDGKDVKRIYEIGARTLGFGADERPLLTADELENLAVQRGTLTDKERLIINGHMVQTIKMLEALPFPRDLKRVPEYAGGHHERMDGGGYPKGIFAGDMSIPARIMAIADVFEALTAGDRPYKEGKTLSQTMEIMGEMKRNNHLDPDLLDLFVRSGVYREYAERFLPKALINEVDEASILAIEPGPLDLPPDSERQKRWEGFLDQYEILVDDVMGIVQKVKEQKD
jgi:HD-GYP domain-containing protein (c-di-GMP phosphodiesterase class II)